MPYPQIVLDVAARVRNWGRWGADDEIGTLNFLTDEVVRAAAGSIRSGKRYSRLQPGPHRLSEDIQGRIVEGDDRGVAVTFVGDGHGFSLTLWAQLLLSGTANACAATVNSETGRRLPLAASGPIGIR